MTLQVITDEERDCHHTEALIGPPDVETADPRSNDGSGRGDGERLSYYVGRDQGRQSNSSWKRVTASEDPNNGIVSLLFDAIGLLLLLLLLLHFNMV